MRQRWLLRPVVEPTGAFRHFVAGNRRGSVRDRHRGMIMSTFEAFLLGMMVAWTPSLLVLAWTLPSANAIESGG
jgi:hypothetical protein